MSWNEYGCPFCKHLYIIDIKEKLKFNIYRSHGILEYNEYVIGKYRTSFVQTEENRRTRRVNHKWSSQFYKFYQLLQTNNLIRISLLPKEQ